MTREQAKELIETNTYSCVLRQGEHILMTSTEKGITPLWQYIQETKSIPKGKLEVADKIIGRAVAFLIVYLGIEYVYTPVLSETARTVFEAFGIHYTYDTSVPYILNKQQNGQCPMEEALASVQNVEEAYDVIYAFRLKRQQMLEKGIL